MQNFRAHSDNLISKLKQQYNEGQSQLKATMNQTINGKHTI